MSYIDTYSIAETVTFRQQCYMSLIKTAISIVAESDTTDNHANRLAFAYDVLRNTTKHTDNMSYAIANYAVDSTDMDIDTKIS